MVFLERPKSPDEPLDRVKRSVPEAPPLDDDVPEGKSSTTSSSLFLREKATLDEWYLDDTAPFPLAAKLFTCPKNLRKVESSSRRGVWSRDEEVSLSARLVANWSIPRRLPGKEDSLNSSNGIWSLFLLFPSSFRFFSRILRSVRIWT